VGGYHFAQFGDPVRQADVLTSEVRRLSATGIPPALDLEAPFSPNATARDFAIQFLNRLRVNGFARVTVYMSSSFAKAIRPDQWGIPGLVIWIASYGPNNGHRNPLTGGYPGRVDIHQYTSVGHVAGISGQVDLNESLADITTTEDELNWYDRVTDPRTGQPALDYYGNTFDYNAQDFYTNRQMAQVTEHTSDRWYTEETQADGAVVLRQAAPPTEEERRAGQVGNRKAARSLDTMDGNYLVGLIDQVSKDVAAVKAAQTAPVPVEIDYDRIINGVVAKLGTLRFDAEPETA
jgi:hypothetical protein